MKKKIQKVLKRLFGSSKTPAIPKLENETVETFQEDAFEASPDQKPKFRIKED